MGNFCIFHSILTALKNIIQGKKLSLKKASFYKRICKKQNFYSLHQLPPPSFQEIYGESNLRSKLTNFSRQQKSILIKNEALSRVKGYVNYISIKKKSQESVKTKVISKFDFNISWSSVFYNRTKQPFYNHVLPFSKLVPLTIFYDYLCVIIFQIQK